MDAERIGVLVAEDNRDLRDAVCALIDAEPDLQITGTATRVSELLDGARTAAARVLVLDLDLAGESSLPALQTLRAQRPQLAVVVFSGNDRDTLAPVFASIGRCEYVMKTGDVLPLLDAIRRVAQN